MWSACSAASEHWTWGGYIIYACLKPGMLKVENFFLDTRNFFPGLDENSRPRDNVTPVTRNYRWGLGYSRGRARCRCVNLRRADWTSNATMHSCNSGPLMCIVSSSSYSFIWGCQTQPTTYSTKNRCRHIHEYTQYMQAKIHLYTQLNSFSSSYYGCRLEMREKGRQCSSLMHIAES